jgi:thiol-disulfide isomerase/thioredoxin
MTMPVRLPIACLAALALAACQREQPPAAQAPEAAADTTTYLAARRGQWVVVNFWATWCAPCLKEMPELSALDAMREHVEVVGLAYEDIDPDAMRAFLQKRPVVYPIAILDVYDPPADFATPRGLPMTYLIAPDGRVAEKFLGPITAAEIEAAIVAAGGPGAPQA